MLKYLAGFILGITITVAMLEGSESLSSLRQDNISLDRIRSQQFTAQSTKNSLALTELKTSVYEEVNKYRLSRGLRSL